MVNVHTDIPFEGMVYASGKYGDLDCTAYGRKNTTTTLRIPLRGCNTHEVCSNNVSIIMVYFISFNTLSSMNILKYLIKKKYEDFY